MKSKPRLALLRLRGVILFTLLLVGASPAQTQEPTESVIESDDPALNTSAENRRRGDLVSIISPKVRSRIETAPVKLTVRLGKGVRPADFYARLNGREITGKFASKSVCHISKCDLTASVIPADGLIKGRNELRVEVLGRGFARDHARRAFFISGPKADAGSNVRSKVGRNIQLNGSKSESKTGYNLTQRWALVQRPASSQAKLTNEASSIPSLIPDVNGTYLAQLVVNDGFFDSEPDTVTILATPDGYLVLVQTRVANADGTYTIKVGETEYTSTKLENGIHLLALDRNTLELNSPNLHATFDTSPNADISPIQNFLKGLNNQQLLIAATTLTSGYHNQALGQALAGFGANSEIGAGLPSQVAFSFIGIAGIGYDEAMQQGGVDDPAKGVFTSNIMGYLTPDSTGLFSFQPKDYIQFQTRDATSVGLTNTMTVGGTQYPAPALPAGAIGGFQVLALERDTLGLIWNRSYGTNSPPSTKLALLEIQRMAGDLSNLALTQADNALVFITSLSGPLPGNADNERQLVRLPCAAGPQTCLPSAMATLGANPYVVSALGPNDTYSLVGARIPPYQKAPTFPSVESSSVITAGNKGAVRGVLTRDHRQRFAPFASDYDPSGQISYELYSLAWEEPVEWPMVDSQQRQAAYSWISSKVCCDDVRKNAYDNLDNAVSNWQFSLSTLNYPDGKNQPCPSSGARSLNNSAATDAIGFSFSDFCDVKGQLSNEFKYVANVRDFRINMLLMFTEQNSNISSTLTSVWTDVSDSFVVPPPDRATQITVDVLGSVLTLLSIIPNPAAAAGAAVASAALNLSTQLARTPQSDTQGKLFTTYGELNADAVKYSEQVQAGLEQLIKNIITDWAKLEAVGQHFAHNDPGWKYDPTQSQLLPAFDTRMTIEYYSKLMPLAFVINDFQNDEITDVNQKHCGTPDVKHEYGRSTPDSWVSYPTQYLNQDKDFNDLFAITEPKPTSDGYYIYPPTGLTDILFKTLGVPKIQFYVQWPLNHQKACTGICTKRICSDSELAMPISPTSK
jgi:hypothetical protein